MVTTRTMTADDVEDVVELNRVAYPNVAEGDHNWTAEQLEAHLELFPAGQVVAELDGRIVGSCSSLVVDFGDEPHRPHTWNEITSHGFFGLHDPRGDTLYGADVCAHPALRGKGIGKAMYEARRELCLRLGCRRIVLGGRLFDYFRHAADMSADEYARAVEAGRMRDPVLGFQLREGFVLRRVMPGYLLDTRSLDHATFLEWLNPDYEGP